MSRRKDRLAAEFGRRGARAKLDTMTPAQLRAHMSMMGRRRWETMTAEQREHMLDVLRAGRQLQAKHAAEQRRAKVAVSENQIQDSTDSSNADQPA